ncbi:MAG: MinD/ParA family protein [Isosphaeraceae bacterium]
MSDQAESLRHLFAARPADDSATDTRPPEPPVSASAWTIQADTADDPADDSDLSEEPGPAIDMIIPHPTRVLCLASGKGGVGTSTLALNLAVSLARKNQRVALVDADYGLGQLEIICDRRPTVDLEDVLSGRIAPWEALVDGPEGVKLLAGSHAARMNEAWLVGPATDELVAQVVTELRDSNVADWILVDVGSGLTARAQTLAAVADGMILTTTPEQASLAASHALLSHLRRAAGSHLKLVTVVNKASSHKVGDEAADRLIQASRLFQGLSVSHLGTVRDDVDVPRSLRSRIAVVQAPGWWLSTAARDFERLATKIHTNFEQWSSAANDLPNLPRFIHRAEAIDTTEITGSASRRAG